jgi:peptidoglycan/xylan/chitin deacetylase (PgdA/CDA1 family)
MHLAGEQIVRLLEACASISEIIPLPELLDRWFRSAPTGGLVALTFDDAYRSLSSADLSRWPRTLFAVGGYAGKPFWWDRVDEVFPLVSSERWDRFEAALGLPDAYLAGQSKSFGRLRPLRQWILAEFVGRFPPHGEELLSELEDETGFRTTQRAMSWDELAAAARDPLVDIGVHTQTHCVLPLVSDQEFDQEISNSFTALREVVPRTIPVLAAPFGLLDRRTLARSASLGIRSVLTLEPRTLPPFVIGRSTPRFCLSNREPVWKLRVKVSGIADRWATNDEAFPDLPSPTS